MIRIYEVDDWQIAKDMETGEIVEEGHNVFERVLVRLGVKIIWLEGKEVDDECLNTGTFYHSIAKYEAAENG